METLREILSESPVRIGFTVVATAIFYAHIVLLTRLSGKRTLAQITTFDFITNISIGSILPAAIVTRGIAFWTGLAVMTTLVGLQWFVTWLAVRTPRFQSLISNPPRLLVYEGRMLPDAMRRERVSEQQLRSKLREQGHARLEGINAVVLETSGAFAVLSHDAPLRQTLLQDIPHPASGPGAAD